MFSFAIPTTAPIKTTATGRVANAESGSISPGSRKPISAKTRYWDEAVKQARKIEDEYTGKEQSSSTPTGGGTLPSPSTEVKTVREAVTKFLEDKEEQNVSKNWLQKYRRELPHFASWCERKVCYIELARLDLIGLEDYRKTWTGAPATRRKRQERLRSFFRYCIRHRWIFHNVAADLERIQTKTPPKLPLTRAQFATVTSAVERYHPRGRDSEWRRMRAMTMLLLLRWSGLRINDAAKLERSRLTDSGSLLLYMQKTGEPVYVPLPPDLVTLLRELRNPENPRYFFWNGTSASASPGIRWWRTLKTIFKTAGLPDAHPHMLRDTFAIEMLLAGVPIDQVSMLLGHSSVKITEKHYLPWVKSRQEQLEASVRRAWAAVPVGIIEQPTTSSARVN